MPSENDCLCLAPTVFPKALEQPCLYNIATDDLYELDQEAYAFLSSCDGTRRIGELNPAAEFLDYCFKEGLLCFSNGQAVRHFNLAAAPVPSLRYLELQITGRCNLRCRHCYQGDAQAPRDLPLSRLLPLLAEFERMQGLRLLISGGEPLCHPQFWALNEALPQFGFRSILITNGVLINRNNAHRLRTHEVQVSLDGQEQAHDGLRGRGSFARTIAAIEALREVGIAVSIATMVTALNKDDFPALAKLMERLGIRTWTVDVPVVAGRLARHRDLLLPWAEAAPLLSYGYGGGLYASSGDYACGAHLCAVLPDGSVSKCGFYSRSPVGHIAEGLENCWRRLPPLRLSQLQCSCPVVSECRGGCRYRAELYSGPLAPDPVQCCSRGVPLGTQKYRTDIVEVNT